MLEGFGSSGEVIEWLPPGASISVQGLWEFCPYNPVRGDVEPNFAQQVEVLRDDLLTADAVRRGVALRALKTAYDDEFGDTGPERNEISLFLYGGPVYASWRQSQLYSFTQAVVADDERVPCYRRLHPWAPGMSDKCSILYSGDAYLDQPAKFDELHAYLGPDRMQKLAVLQVNHHGARGNWHAGLAARINPVVSVFSSRPSVAPHHPHQIVWDDFAHHGRMQVNTHGQSSCGWMLV